MKNSFVEFKKKTKYVYADKCTDNELKKDSEKRVLLERDHDATCILFS